MNIKIRKGDTVRVISGREEDRGKEGEVIKVFPAKRRLVVQGVNMRSKHQRQVQSQGRTIAPGIVKFEAPLHISNAMLVCPKCHEATRVIIHRENGKPVRVCKKCDGLIDS